MGRSDAAAKRQKISGWDFLGTSTVSPKHQVVLIKEVLPYLTVEIGETVEYWLNERREIVIRKTQTERDE
jgi:hypothetical protein